MQTSAHHILIHALQHTLKTMLTEGKLPTEAPLDNFVVEPKPELDDVDYATNAALVLAKAAKTNPRALAKALLRPYLPTFPPALLLLGQALLTFKLIPNTFKLLSVNWRPILPPIGR
jgi:arginyl-tRNA synthetase